MSLNVALSNIASRAVSYYSGKKYAEQKGIDNESDSFEIAGKIYYRQIRTLNALHKLKEFTDEAIYKTNPDGSESPNGNVYVGSEINMPSFEYP